MRILHLSTSDIGGGAARAAFRLHTGLLRLGHDSTMLALRRTSGQDSVIQMRWHRDLLTRLRRRWHARNIASDFERFRATLPADFENFNDDRTESAYDLVKHIADLPPFDVINLHWVAGFVDYQVFLRHARMRKMARVPLVWRLADMNAFTGGCHYDRGCGKFSDRCGACPILGSSVDDDLSRQVWRRKHRALARLAPQRLHVVGTSGWIAEQARQSTLLGRFPISVIPNGLDTDVFAPGDRAAARQGLGVPADAKVVLFVADSAANTRKGFACLAAALDQLVDVPDLFLLSVGGGTPNVPARPQLHLGKVQDDALLAQAYSAADVFVIPSLQESFGQTVIESMACGTPVVGFDAGGIPDMVRPGETGQLAPVADPAALAEGIRQVIADPQRWAAMSQRCRAAVERDFSLAVQAGRYAVLYQSIRAGGGTARPIEGAVAR